MTYFDSVGFLTMFLLIGASVGQSWRERLNVFSCC